jgi:hypothetical protein
MWNAVRHILNLCRGEIGAYLRASFCSIVTTSPSATASTGHGAISCRPRRRSSDLPTKSVCEKLIDLRRALWGDRAPLVDGDLEVFQLSVEVRALNAEHPRSVGNTTAVLIESGGNVLALEPRARLAQGSPGG